MIKLSLTPRLENLDAVKAEKIASLNEEYRQQKTAPVRFINRKGIEAYYTRDVEALANLQAVIAMQKNGISYSTIPRIWLDHMSRPVGWFVYEDFQDLHNAIANHRPVAYYRLVLAVEAVLCAPDIRSVNAIELKG